MNSSDVENSTWNEGGGISDYMGWADQAILNVRDTESVRDFEASRNIVENYDYDDDSTIATNFDDDASIATAMVTPRNANHSFDEDYYNGSEIYKSQSADQYALTDIDDSYGDAVINVPASFNDISLSGGLSFGVDGDFDGPEYDGGGESVEKGYSDNLDGFGDTGLGGFGMLSPGQDHRKISQLSPPSLADNSKDALNRPWANTTKGDEGGDMDQPWASKTTLGNKGSDLDRPWATTASTTTAPTTTNNKGDDLDRPWATSTSKGSKPDQPRKWFSAWGGGKGT